MQIRKPAVAGQFYPEDRETCLAEIRQCLPAEVPGEGLPTPLVGGLVPHAGWTFSGAVAALVFAAVKRRRGTVGTFVICGAAHGYFGRAAGELALSQAALVASIVGDRITDVWCQPIGTTGTRNRILERMHDNGAISDGDLRAAMAQPLELAAPPPGHAPCK